MAAKNNRRLFGACIPRRSSLSHKLAVAVEELVPGFEDRPILTANRAPGTMSRQGEHKWAANKRRLHQILVSTLPKGQLEIRGAHAEPNVTPSAAIFHRALEIEWADADVVIRSITTRAHDVSTEDAQAAKDFFDVTDAFFRSYLEASEFMLRSECMEELTALRADALRALDDFAIARETFLHTQGIQTVEDFHIRAHIAKQSMLAVTRAEAVVAGEMLQKNIGQIATHISASSGGPFLVLMVARAVESRRKDQHAWASRVLFSWGFRVLRPRAMKMVEMKFDQLHRACVTAFRDAEWEYRELFGRGVAAAEAAEAAAGGDGGGEAAGSAFVRTLLEEQARDFRLAVAYLRARYVF